MSFANDTTGTTMLVQPSGFSNGGFGNGFGGDGWWILLLFILLGCNGFGNGFGAGNGFYPWMNNSDQINAGFQNQLLNSNITGIQNSINGVNAAVMNGFAQSEIAANSRQMADMNQNFALQSSLQNCCCENRQSIADLKYTLAQEACADRAAVSAALTDVLQANAANTQRILDQMCSDKIDAKNEKIAELQREIQMAQLAASQVSQTATIEQFIASQNAAARTASAS
ncbi:MAG: hypothetical protein J5617_04050 [Bacilli bacterium]|nr:hypothetical protein [Bacilli bacterium]